MRNVHFRMDEQLALEIRSLRGSMAPLSDYDVIDFGNPESFSIRIDYAEVGMSMFNLAYLLNRYVFDYEGAPLTISSITPAGDMIRQEGTLHNVVDIPFEMTASVSVTPEGLIRLRPTSMMICDIPGQGLMRALGVALEDLIDVSGVDGVQVNGNDLLMNPEEILPPPAIRGRLTGVRVVGDELVQVFGAPEDAPDIPPPPRPDIENYMFYSGGTLHFGKLFMVEADLQIVDTDPSDPLDFFLREYQSQLSAGYSEMMPDGGLVAHFPDYDSIAAVTER